MKKKNDNIKSFSFISIKLSRFGRFKTRNSIIQFKLLNCFNRWDLSDFEQRMAISDLWPRDTFLSTTKAPLHWLPPIYFTEIFIFTLLHTSLQVCIFGSNRGSKRCPPLKLFTKPPHAWNSRRNKQNVGTKQCKQLLQQFLAQKHRVYGCLFTPKWMVFRKCLKCPFRIQQICNNKF